MNTENNAPTYPLARDTDGNPIAVPANATAWRVRKMATRAGRPKLIYDNETGLPLELPLTASIQELAEVVSEDGRFRLEGVDQDGRAIPGCVAVTAFEFPDDETEPAPIAPSTMMEQLMCRLIESNTRVTEALASRFAQVPPPLQASSIVVESTPTAPNQNQAANMAGVAEVIKQFSLSSWRISRRRRCSPTPLPLRRTAPRCRVEKMAGKRRGNPNWIRAAEQRRQAEDHDAPVFDEGATMSEQSGSNVAETMAALCAPTLG